MIDVALAGEPQGSPPTGLGTEFGLLFEASFSFEGAEQDEAAMRGEILSIVDPGGPMAKASSAIAVAMGAEAQAPVPAESQEKRHGRKIFGLG